MPTKLFFNRLLQWTSLCLLAGCGSAAATVSGTVVVDGQPVERGTISLVPADSKGSVSSAPIRDGRYEIRTVAGKKFVQISAPLVIEKRKESNHPHAPWVEVAKERLPPRFNSRTELTYEVHGGANAKDWTLSARPNQSR